jgi:hypothetical protein
VLAGEQQRGPFPPELGLECLRIALELRLEFIVGGLGQQFDRCFEVGGAGEDPLPEVDLGTEAVGLPEDPLGASLVIPEAGRLGQGLELGNALALGLEVKDAPRSTGSVRPGRGWRTRPLVPGLEILEQDRPQFDESKGGLAPSDDGVHAGTVAIVRAHAAVAVTVQGCRVTAGSAVTLAGDQIDERGFFGLLQWTPSIRRRWALAAGAGATCQGTRAVRGRRVGPV